MGRKRTKKEAVESDGPSGLHARMATLLEKHTLSAIAVKTNTPFSSVHGYFNGRKVPADFCRALVTAFGLNPAWLLMGEGEAYLTDVTAATAHNADQVLELVNAMNAISRKRLGELLGKDHAIKLKDLDLALSLYEKTRQELNNRFSAFYRKLLHDFEGALKEGERERSETLRAAIIQISRFSDDPELATRFQKLDVIYQRHCGNYSKALAIRRGVFFRALFEDVNASAEKIINETGSLVTSLQYDSRMREALRICRAVDGYLRDEPAAEESRQYLTVVHAMAEIQTGHIISGMARLSRIYPGIVDGRLLGVADALLFRGHFLGCTLPDHALNSMMNASDFGKSEFLKAALWMEERDWLERALKAHEAAEVVTPEKARILLPWAAALFETPRGGKIRRSPLPAQLLREATDASAPQSEGAPSPFVRLLASAHVAQCRRPGSSDSRHAIVECDNLLTSMGPGIEPDLIWQGIHYRNVLRECARDNASKTSLGPVHRITSRATDFFTSLVERGYLRFRSAIISS